MRDVPQATGSSRRTVLVSDPQQRTDKWVQKEYGPETFAVSGDVIVLPNEVRNDLTVYVGGHRASRLRLRYDVYPEDLLIRGDRLYLLSSRDFEDTLARVWVYRITGAGRLRLETHLDAEVEQVSWARLEFFGESLAIVFDDPVVVSGPGPVVQPVRFRWNKQAVTARWTDATPSVRFHATGWAKGIELAGRDSRFVWYAVFDSRQYRTTVYRVPVSGDGPVRAYRLHRGGEGRPSREVVIADGRVYQLLVTRNATAAQVLLVRPVG